MNETINEINLDHFYYRAYYLSFIPVSLCTICGAFINFSNCRIRELESNDDVEEDDNLKNRLIWDGKPSQLGYILGTLAELGYIMPAKRKNGKINYTQFSKDVLELFKVEGTIGTLSKY